MPEVSIIMNCHNGETYLSEALDSIYSQNFSDWEIVFWDNASTDSSSVIAKSYDNRLKYYRSDSLTTLGFARRSAVDVCNGTWISFLDTDDFWFPYKLTTQLEALRKSDYVLAYSGITEMDRAGHAIRNNIPAYTSGDIFEQLLYQFDINMVTPMIRRDVLSRYDINFEESISASEEYNLFMRLAAKGPVLVQPVVLGKYRIYEGSLSDRQISRWAIERNFTLDQLLQENPNIERRYPLAFREARNRAVYYKARYQASMGDFEAVRATMRKIASQRLLYRLLYWVSSWPWLWAKIHNSKRNGMLGSLVLFFRRTERKA